MRSIRLPPDLIEIRRLNRPYGVVVPDRGQSNSLETPNPAARQPDPVSARRATLTFDPVPLRELVGLADGEDHDSLPASYPRRRILTGAEEVHLASCGACGAGRCARRSDAGQHDAQNRLRRTDFADAFGCHGEPDRGSRDRAGREGPPGCPARTLHTSCPRSSGR
jgi:hypothetical protein